jgi:hydrogenase maturation protease
MSLLVIGYGNTLRCDDGVGPQVAESLAARNLPGVRAVACQQLTPELAEAVAQAGAVVFVDAALDAGQVEWREVKAEDPPQTPAHASNPRQLLSLARQLFGRQPPAWVVAVPVEHLGMGESLSPRAAAGLQTATAQIEKFAQSLGSKGFR